MKLKTILLIVHVLVQIFISNIAGAQGVKKIYLAMDDHTDFMWSADEQTYHQAFLDMLDYYIEMADSTGKTEPMQFQSKFVCDGSYWVYVYEQNRPPQQFRKLIECIRSGHITVPITLLTLCYGGMPAETVIRSMYYAGSLERRFNLRLAMAAPMENQTMPAGVGSLWAGAGAEYCWMGICGCASRMQFQEPRAHEIYWWQGLDGSKLLTKWNSLNNADSLSGWSNENMGGYAEARYPVESIHYVETDSNFKLRYPYNIIGIFGKGWDDIKTESIEFIDVAKKLSNNKRQVIVSNEVDFFQEFERTYGSTLPEYLAAFGNEWDIYPSSMAGLTARMKNAVEKLRSAEALASFISLHDSTFMNAFQKLRDKAYLNMGLFYNHDWTVDGPVSKSDYQKWARRLVNEVDLYVHSLYDDARLKLADFIQKNPNYRSIYVFNPLGWQRTDVASIEFNIEKPVHIIDSSTGKETPSQIILKDGKRYLQWLAAAVPSVGYKIYEIRNKSGKSFQDAASFEKNILENDFYRLMIADRGAITSLVDKKQQNREFVQQINGKAVNDLGTGSGTSEIENIGPVSATILAKSASPLNHSSRITLYSHSNRIDIENQITQNFDSVGDEPPTWAFSFAIENPTVRHEEIGAVIQAKLLSEGGHYSPTHARYDWLTLNHFASMSGSNGSITLSNRDCSFFKVGHSSVEILDSKIPQISVLIGGQIDGPKLGIPKQGGDSLFTQRFALRTGERYNQTEEMRFALEHQNPLVTGFITGRDAFYSASEFSLLNFSDRNVLLWALKPAEDGFNKSGLIIRVWNMSNESSKFQIQFPNHEILGGKGITHIETPVSDASVSENRLDGAANQFQLKSYSIQLKGR